MIISAIVAIDEKNAIGFENDLPWPAMSADLRRFSTVTKGAPLIMGRKTYDSILEQNGSILPGRKSIVVTRNPYFMPPPGVMVYNSLGMALFEAQKLGHDEVFIIGGAEIFKQALGRLDRIYLTKIRHVFEADTFLPDFDLNNWDITQEENFEADSRNPFAYSFFTLNKKKPEEAQPATK